jgi:predicted phage tail protein
MRDVFLHGAPGRQFGRRWRLDVSSPAEAVRALIALRPQLRQVFRKGWWRVIVGPPHIKNGIEAEHLTMNMGSQTLHIVPATAPRGEDGALGLIAGAVLMIVGVVLFATGYGAALAPYVFSLGLSLAASGVAALLTPKAAPVASTDQARPDDRPSFFFNGVTNNTQQGGPVPLVFGTHLTGSVVISGSINAENT